jgi:hypothetical protein
MNLNNNKMKIEFRGFIRKEDEIKSALNNQIIKDRVQSLWLKAYVEHYRKQLKKSRVDF